MVHILQICTDGASSKQLSVNVDKQQIMSHVVNMWRPLKGCQQQLTQCQKAIW